MCPFSPKLSNSPHNGRWQILTGTLSLPFRCRLQGSWKVAEPSFVVPIWCYVLVNNWEFRLKRRMNPSDVILFIVSEDLCPTTHQVFPHWPVFAFCPRHFPLGYWCAALPGKLVLSLHFVKLTPRANTGFCCTVCKEGCLRTGRLNIPVKLFLREARERRANILLHILLIPDDTWKCILFPGKAKVDSSLWSRESFLHNVKRVT